MVSFHSFIPIKYCAKLIQTVVVVYRALFFRYNADISAIYRSFSWQLKNDKSSRYRSLPATLKSTNRDGF